MGDFPAFVQIIGVALTSTVAEKIFEKFDKPTLGRVVFYAGLATCIYLIIDKVVVILDLVQTVFRIF